MTGSPRGEEKQRHGNASLEVEADTAGVVSPEAKKC